MPYDLYGQYYSSARDAENAELAQCAEIDARHAAKEVSQLRDEISYNQQNEQGIWQYIGMLEERIKTLEQITNHLKPN